MSNDNTPLDDMKAALESAGCNVSYGYQTVSVQFPDGESMSGHDVSGTVKAYERLQEKQKTKALEAFVLKIAQDKHHPDARYHEDFSDAVVSLGIDARRIVKQFNITADDDSADSENEA